MKKLFLLGIFSILLLSGCNTAEVPGVSLSEQTSASASAATQSSESLTQSNDETTVVASSEKPNPGRAAQHLTVDGEIYRDVYAWSSLLMVSSDDGYDVVQSNNINAYELAENALKKNNRLGVTIPVDGQPQNELEISDTVYSEEVYRVDESLLILVSQIEDFIAEGLSDDVIQRIADRTVYYGRYFTTIGDTDSFESAYPNVAELAGASH